ncbi:YveK family protein [Weissella paramesenteroides]|uniref:YveK family protein n=1 Tax=Weissella paramesenteroides TaxID=1249 RepID=UPI00103F5C37|nr:capsular biosynthesis protein [Weissella paramesenteroides]RZQ58377.1 capsular biosynthesis protein [Weissella paramesenteroides]
MENQFTITDLIKHLLRNAWWIIVLAIIGGASMYFINKQPTAISYSAKRSMYIGNKNNNVKDPNSRVMADSWMMKTYESIAKDDKIIKPAISQLKKEHVKIKAGELKSSISLDNQQNTLLLDVQSVNASNPKNAAKMVNAYTESFEKNAPLLISDMPKPELMSKATNAHTDVIVASSPKKAALFGLVAGAIIGIILSLFTGIYKNMKSSEN